MRTASLPARNVLIATITLAAAIGCHNLATPAAPLVPDAHRLQRDIARREASPGLRSRHARPVSVRSGR